MQGPSDHHSMPFPRNLPLTVPLILDWADARVH
jgi:hypothetical protein